MNVFSRSSSLCFYQNIYRTGCWKKFERTSVILKSKFLATGFLQIQDGSHCFCSHEKKNIYEFEKKADAIKNVLQKNKEKLLDAENKLRQRSGEIIKDLKHHKEITELKIREQKELIIENIKEKKSRVKEKIDEVIERENIYTIPNILCVTRIIMSPFLGYEILQQHYSIAMALWLFAGVTDLLDGWIARRWSSQSSKMGSFLDPMADKILVATLFLTLTYQGLIPVYLTLLIIARDVLLVVAGFVIRYRSLSPPRTLSRYFDVGHVTAQLAPTFISKVNTAVQLLLVGTTLGAPIFEYVDHPILQGLWMVTAASTVVAGLSYVFSKNTYKFIKHNMK